MLVQFLGSQQDLSTCRMKKRKQSLSTILAFRSSVQVSAIADDFKFLHFLFSVLLV